MAPPSPYPVSANILREGLTRFQKNCKIVEKKGDNLQP
jgi:hypothetical protein